MTTWLPFIYPLPLQYIFVLYISLVALYIDAHKVSSDNDGEFEYVTYTLYTVLDSVSKQKQDHA